jgi:tight adherence protein B
MNKLLPQITTAFLTFITTYYVTNFITRSHEISLAIGLVLSTLPHLIIRKRLDAKTKRQESLWPEAIESVISALHSGRSISEAIVELEEYGPQGLVYSWSRISRGLRDGNSLDNELRYESDRLASPRADQFFATLIFAKEYGGNSVQSSLRQLSQLMRDEHQVHEEIETKFGWIRNSAILAATAPWILLLILSSQPNTIQAFATDGGKMILSIGIAATAIAYLWMERLAKIPSTPRILSLAGPGE